jgi:hemolysin activation/secretion protein
MVKRCDRSCGRIAWPAAMIAVAGMCTGVALAQQSAGKPEVPPTEPPPVQEDFAPAAPNAVAQGTPDPDKPTFLVGPFILRYGVEHPQYPALDDLARATVTLGRSETGFVRPGGGVPTATYTLEELADQPAQRYTFEAIRAVANAVRVWMNEQENIVGVTVSVEDQIAIEELDGQIIRTDIRPKGQTALTLTISSAIVNKVRSVAFGEKVKFEDRIDNPRYERIVANSPIKPYSVDDDDRDDLLRKDRLDDYVYRLNRHPGRRVDLGIAAADEANALVLDYYINENKPWLVYGQISNTGTEQTSEWRERLGFVNNQLTNHDDILSIDFVTADFDSSNAFNVSYDRPIWGDWLRLRGFGSWSDFTASDVGAPDQNFEGDSWSLGTELEANVYQHRDWFVDTYLGARWDNIGIESFVNDSVVTNDANTNFFIVSLGTRLEHITDTQATTADLGFEFDLPDVADTDKTAVENNFQRVDADNNWLVFQWDLGHSFYLEPLFIPTAWRNMDIKDPDASPSLAHEMAVSFRGQYAFGDRLIPNYQQVAGGLYTVRGYPESIAAGDSILIGSLEYRFHLPQALGFDDTPGQLFGHTFRYRPQAPYGRADWDLILKGFFDAARTIVSSPQPGEEDLTLLGTGVGLEFLYRRNLSVRLDWGVALEEIENEVSAGSNRFHISATILY